jgi:hypothetical protein
MFVRDGETWMWLANSGASRHVTSVRRDFCEYRALIDRLWVNGIIARVVGVGSVCFIVKADAGEHIPAILKNVFHVPELSRLLRMERLGLVVHGLAHVKIRLFYMQNREGPKTASGFTRQLDN